MTHAPRRHNVVLLRKRIIRIAVYNVRAHLPNPAVNWTKVIVFGLTLMRKHFGDLGAIYERPVRPL